MKFSKSFVMNLLMLSLLFSIISCGPSAKYVWEATKGNELSIYKVQEYKNFVKNYPNTPEADEANAFIDKIEEKAKKDVALFDKAVEERALKIKENWGNLDKGMPLEHVRALVGPFHLHPDPLVQEEFNTIGQSSVRAKSDEVYYRILKDTGARLSFIFSGVKNSIKTASAQIGYPKFTVNDKRYGILFSEGKSELTLSELKQSNKMQYLRINGDLYRLEFEENKLVQWSLK